jgi:hypothetical protein
MAIATVVEETAGVRRYQVVQTASDALTVRLETLRRPTAPKCGGE